MTRVFLNQTEVSGLPTGLLSLDAIIRHLEVNFLQPDTVIRQIHLDGQPVIQDTREATEVCLRTSLEGREKVEVFTGSVHDISRESIVEAIHYLNRVEAITPSICVSFRASPTGESYQMLRQLYDGFYWVHLLVDRLKATFGERVTQSVGGNPQLADLTTNFRSVLRKLIQAQENEDFILISDLLEYGLLPLVPQWRSTLEAMAVAVGACR